MKTDLIVPACSGEPGIKVDFPDSYNELDIFECFITDELIDYITKETNKYTAQYIAANPTMGPQVLTRSWKDVTAIEIEKVFTLCLLMGVVQKPQLHLYWRQDLLLKASIFNVVMLRNRFQVIIAFLHFAGNSDYDINDPNHDRLCKVRAVIEYIVDRFKSVYEPSEFVCIDEELLLWKGRLSFKQFIPNKRSRFGIKFFSLCETSGYLWNSLVYLGSKGIITEEGRAIERLLGKSAVAPKLISDLFGKGYKLYVDNWYTSEKLLKYLEESGTAVCGTARANRLQLPKSLKKEPLQKGQCRFLRGENMLVVSFYDKKMVTINILVVIILN